MVHQGAESWTIRLNLPFGLSVPLTNGLRGINITLPPYKKIDHYMVMCRRYRPAISSADLAGCSHQEVCRLIGIEIETMRRHMNAMTDELKVMMVEKTTKETAEKMQTDNFQWQEIKGMINRALFPEDEAFLMAA